MSSPVSRTSDASDAQSFTFHESFVLFCEGCFMSGPQWYYMLEYWEESVRRHNKV
jgi:hypothetical protein